MRKSFAAIGAEMEQGEQGFMLVGLIVAIFFILLVLSVAAPKVAKELRREQEVEAVHRGNQYVRAIRLYYRKNGTYPGSMEQLEKTNNIRFLRQQYVDPLTGKADWKLIHVGEAKTTVKGFFGQPLTGMAPGLGSAAGLGSAGAIGAGATGPGQTGSGSAFGGSAYGGSTAGGSGFGGSSSGSGGLGSSGPATLGGSSGSGSAPGASGPGGGTLGAGSSGTGSTNTLGSASGIQSQSGSSFTGASAPFVGVGVPKEGNSIIVLNEQTTYNTWELIYDPRIEQLYAKGALFGGGASGLGSAAGNSSGFGQTPGAGSTPSGFGSAPSGFGSTPGSGYGSTSGSGFGSTAPTTPPQQPQ
jgi:type II secretory pathway pseudopilin PulG